MPPYSTWSRILAHAVDPLEVEQIVGQFFHTAASPTKLKRGRLQLAVDGKTLCGTIPLGQTRGAHLLAAYLPEQGVVLAQMQGGEKTNEIGQARRLLGQLDLRGVVVTGDAMFAQRELSLQIVQAHGDYLWIVKDNQEGLREEIETLFQPHRPESPPRLCPPIFAPLRPSRKDMGGLTSARLW